MEYKNDIKELINIIKRQSSFFSGIETPEKRKSVIATMYSLDFFNFQKQFFTSLCYFFLESEIKKLEDPFLLSILKKTKVEFSPPHCELIIVRFVIPRELEFFEDIFFQPLMHETIKNMFDSSYEIHIKTSFNNEN